MAGETTGRHGRTGIVDVAVRLLDEHGLPDLTMRRLAAELDVRPSALYWHFDSKQVLLAAVADRIVGEAVAPEGAAVGDVAGALRDALLRHRDGAEVVLSSQALSLGADEARRRIAEALPADVGAAGAAALLPFVLGHASIVQQRLQAARMGVLDTPPDVIAAEAEADFAAGLRIVLAGLGVA
ncbi:TetR family transcriptional regulator [Microbacterium gilvum]